MSERLVAGCGYLGERVARLWREAGDRVYVITRSAERAERFEREGYRPIVADLTDGEGLAPRLGTLGVIDTVLVAISPDRGADPVRRREVTIEGLKNLLAAISPQISPQMSPAMPLAKSPTMPPSELGKLVYISTTGVYGQADGSWIDETSPRIPTREGGRVSQEAESLLRAHPLGQRSIILRLAGIYGPGRLPSAADLLAGKPLAVSPDSYLNLIHVEDAARIAVAVADQIEPPDDFLVSDGCPVLRREYYQHLAKLLGAPAPIFALTEPPPPAERRNGGDKRVSNAKLKAQVPLNLRYPSYREGLAAIAGRGRQIEK